MAKKGKGSAKKGKTLVSRGGLLFSVPLVYRLMKRRMHTRISKAAAVFMTAILEYTVAEILELAGDSARMTKIPRILPRHLCLAIRGDEELDKMMNGFIASGGVFPHIHQFLMATQLASPEAPEEPDAPEASEAPEPL